MGDGRRGRVVVSTILTVATLLIPATIMRFKARLPEAAVTVLEGSNDQHLPTLLRGEIDMAVARVPNPALAEQLTQEPLFQETLRLFVRVGPPLAAGAGTGTTCPG